jgi:hypothetical protein
MTFHFVADPSREIVDSDTSDGRLNHERSRGLGVDFRISERDARLVVYD